MKETGVVSVSLSNLGAPEYTESMRYRFVGKIVKNLTRNEQPLIVSSVVILFSLLTALSFFFLSATSRRELLVLEYDASRTRSALVERIAEDGDLPEDAVSEPILGFGLYSPAGEPIYLPGSAPASLPSAADPGESVEFYGDRIEIMRPLGRMLPDTYLANLGIIEEEVERLSLLSDRAGEFLRSGDAPLGIREPHKERLGEHGRRVGRSSPGAG